MAKFMTAARKITAARLTGIGIGAGVMGVITRDLSVVCPMAGVAVVGAVMIHHHMQNIPEDAEVGMDEIASVVGRAAGEVVLASALLTVAKSGIKGLLQKRPAVPAVDVEVTVEFTPHKKAV